MKVQFYPDDIDSDIIEVPDDITEDELYDMACKWVADNVAGFFRILDNDDWRSQDEEEQRKDSEI